MNAQPTEPVVPTTRIVVDMRESSLYDSLRTLLDHDDAQYSWVSLEKGCLEIGDVHILPPNGHDKVIIERKTVQDVAASIQDGRWSEQKHRALANVSPHQLLYLIEVGDMSKLFDTMHVKMHGRIQYDTVLNAILHLWIRYRIPYVYLQGTSQSAQYIHRLAFQYHRQATDTTAIRPSTQERYDQSLLQSHYHSVASQKRKNMNSLAFFRMTLQIIPGISQKIATNIQQLFEEGGFLSLVDFIRDHDKAMFHALYRTKYGRALNRDVVDTLYEYVLDTTLVLPASPTTQPPAKPNREPRPRHSLLLSSNIPSPSSSSNI